MNEQENIIEQIDLLVDQGIDSGDLKWLADELKNYRVEDIAESFSSGLSDKNLKILFHTFPDEVACDLLYHLESNARITILESISVEKLSALFHFLSIDETADLLNELHEDEKDKIIEQLSHPDAQKLKEILTYEEGTAGSIMNPKLPLFYEDNTVAQAIAKLRKIPSDELEDLRIFTVDKNKKLAGRLSLKKLIVSNPRSKLKTFSKKDTAFVYTDTDQEEVAHIAEKYSMVLIPVVNHDKVLVGLIAADSLMNVIHEEATEDMMRMVGSSDEELDSIHLMRSGFLRLPWLFVSLLSSIMMSKFIGVYHDSLTKVPILASFIPLCMAMPGNAGSQSAMVMVRGLSTGVMNSSRWFYYLLREMSIGAILGAVVGLFSALFIYGANYQLDSAIQIALVVAISVFFSMVIATLMGSFIPLIFNALKIDPALASGPFVTTLNDFFGLVVYFSIASFIL